MSRTPPTFRLMPVSPTQLLVTVAVAFALMLVAIAAKAETPPPASNPAMTPTSATAAALSPEQALAIRQALEGKLPPGTEIVIETKDGGSRVQDERAEGVGAGARARGTEVKQDVTGSAPEANLDGTGRAKGGDHDANTEAKSPVAANLWANPLIYAGILCGLGAGACFWPLRIGVLPAIVLSVLAAAFIVSAIFPAVLVWGLALAGVAAGGYLLVKGTEHRSALITAAGALETANGLHEGLRAVVSGVAGLKAINPAAYEAVKASIGTQADPADVQVIDEIKRADGWKS